MTHYLLTTYDCIQWSLIALKADGEVDPIASGGIYTYSSSWSDKENFIALLVRHGVKLHEGDTLIYCVDGDIQDVFTIRKVDEILC